MEQPSTIAMYSILHHLDSDCTAIMSGANYNWSNDIELVSIPLRNYSNHIAFIVIAVNNYSDRIA